jgi:hypothetical protein
MLTIEIHVDNLEDKKASPHASNYRENAKTKVEKGNNLFVKLTSNLKTWLNRRNQ